MRLYLEGTCMSVTPKTGRKKDGTSFEIAIVSIWQENEPQMAIVKMDVADAPAVSEKVLLPVYPSGWVGKSGNVNVDLYLSKR